MSFISHKITEMLFMRTIYTFCSYEASLEFFIFCVTNEEASTLLCSVVKCEVSGWKTKETKGEKRFVSPS